jgi:hypothetical protein
MVEPRGELIAFEVVRFGGDEVIEDHVVCVAEREA